MRRSDQSALTKALRELRSRRRRGVARAQLWRGITFTDSGQVLLKRARFALSSLEKAREEIGVPAARLAPCLSIATTPLLAMEVLPKVLRDFERIEPAAELHLCEGLLTTVVPELLQGRIDFAVALANAKELPGEIEFEPLQAIDALPAGRNDNPFVGARKWADLKDSRWALNISGGSQGQMLLQLA